MNLSAADSPNRRLSCSVTPVITIFGGVSRRSSSRGLGKKSPSTTGVRSKVPCRLTLKPRFPNRLSSMLWVGSRRKNSTIAAFCSDREAETYPSAYTRIASYLTIVVRNEARLNCKVHACVSYVICVIQRECTESCARHGYHLLEQI